MCDGKEVTCSDDRKWPGAEAPLGSQLHSVFQLSVNWLIVLFLKVSVKVLLKPTIHFLLNGAISSWECDIKSRNESEYLTHIHLTSLSSLKRPLLALSHTVSCTDSLHFRVSPSPPRTPLCVLREMSPLRFLSYIKTVKIPPQPIECHVYRWSIKWSRRCVRFPSHTYDRAGVDKPGWRVTNVRAHKQIQLHCRLIPWI